MGLACRACDTLVRREVAVKTNLDIADPAKRIKRHSNVGSGMSLAVGSLVFAFPAEIKSRSPASAPTLS
jgi:hypothetical protein